MLQFFVIHRSQHLNTVDEITWHPVGRTEVVFGIAAIGEDEYSRMFEICVDDAHCRDVLADARKSWNERAVASNENTYLHSRLRSLVELCHHVLIGDVVYLHLYPCLKSLLGIAHLVGDESQYLGFHLIRRHKQFAELHWFEWFADKLKHLLHLAHYLRSCCHHHIVSVYLGIALVQVACSDTSNISALA